MKPDTKEQKGAAHLSGASSERGTEQKDAAVAMHFLQVGEFRAMRLAEEWLEQNGYAVGPCQKGAPRGIMPAEYVVMKWRNLRLHERAALHGTMTGNMRDGPVCITLTRTTAPDSRDAS